jgi:hypothetical protein
VNVQSGGLLKRCQDMREAGAARVCEYNFEHVAALVRLGHYNYQQARQGPLSIPIQVTAVEKDGYVGAGRITRFVESQKNAGAPIRLCFFRENIPHTMLSPYDNPAGTNMFWLEALLAGAADFIADGIPFPADDPNPPEHDGWPWCRIA